MKHIISKKDRALFAELVRTDFKLRYQNSILGYVWSLLKPLMLFAILFVVFTQFIRLGAGVPNYAQSLLLGIVLWTFFVEATNMSLKSIVARGSLIRKINIPRWLIPISVIASAFINMSLNLIVVFIFVSLASNIAVSWWTLLIFPLLILQLAVLSAGVGLFLAALYVRFRDMDPLWEVARQGLFYSIPIIYPLDRIPSEVVQKVILMNPLAQIIQDARSVITYSGTIQISDVYHYSFMTWVPVLITAAVFIIGLSYFRKQSKYFAENV